MSRCVRCSLPADNQKSRQEHRIRQSQSRTDVLAAILGRGGEAFGSRRTLTARPIEPLRSNVSIFLLSFSKGHQDRASRQGSPGERSGPKIWDYSRMGRRLLLEDAFSVPPPQAALIATTSPMKNACFCLLLMAVLWFAPVGFQDHGMAQDQLAPLVDPNVNVPVPLPGSLTEPIAPLNEPFVPMPQEDVAPGTDPGTSFAPRQFVPDTPVPAPIDPQVPVPGEMPWAPAGQIPPGNVPVPGSFPEAINESMVGWMDWSQWDSSVELGINGSSGNSESFNISSGFDLNQNTERTETRIDFNYINNRSNDVLVAHNARLTIDWEKKFGEELGQRFEPSRWSWFIKNTYFYDEFQPFDLRIALNSGVGYKFLETEIQMLKGRFGAGASREVGGINDEWIPEALFGLDYRRQISKRQKVNLTIDFFPSWEDFSDYRLVNDFAWEFLLDEATNLSLKFNVNNQYDSTPDGGAVANDVFYSLLMLWKF